MAPLATPEPLDVAPEYSTIQVFWKFLSQSLILSIQGLRETEESFHCKPSSSSSIPRETPSEKSDSPQSKGFLFLPFSCCTVQHDQLPVSPSLSSRSSLLLFSSPSPPPYPLPLLLLPLSQVPSPPPSPPLSLLPSSLPRSEVPHSGGLQR